MKKLLLLAAAAALFCTAAQAQNAEADQQQKESKKARIIGVGFLPGLPASQDNSVVSGLKLGIPVVTGKNAEINGLEASLGYAGTETMNGLQAAIFMTDCKAGSGVQLAIPMNCALDSFKGWQGSVLFNQTLAASGVQTALFNFADDFNGYQHGFFSNITGKACGFQLSCLNVATDQMDGAQISVVNYARRSAGICQVGVLSLSNGRSVQIGGINYAQSGFQFGLVNVMKKGFLPVMILFNFSI